MNSLSAKLAAALRRVSLYNNLLPVTVARDVKAALAEYDLTTIAPGTGSPVKDTSQSQSQLPGGGAAAPTHNPQ